MICLTVFLKFRKQVLYGVSHHAGQQTIGGVGICGVGGVGGDGGGDGGMFLVVVLVEGGRRGGSRCSWLF